MGSRALLVVLPPPPSAWDGSRGDCTIANVQQGEYAANLDAPPLPPRQSSDPSHIVKDGEMGVAMIAMVSPLPTRWACSLSVLQSVARPHLHTRQYPLLGGHVIPHCIAIVPPMQAHGRDGC
jgi:hypothetical protein